MLKILTDDYVVYEVWECDENGMAYTFLDHFDSYVDAENDMNMRYAGVMLGGVLADTGTQSNKGA